MFMRYFYTGSTYHEMAQLFNNMPRHYKLKRRIAELNKNWNITSTPDGTCGVQQSLVECLRFCIEGLVSNAFDMMLDI